MRVHFLISVLLLQFCDAHGESDAMVRLNQAKTFIEKEMWDEAHAALEEIIKKTNAIL